MKITDNALRILIKEEILKLRIEDVHGDITEQLIDTSEKSQEHYTEEAIRSFQTLYRSLDVDTKHFFVKWLRKAIIKTLTFDEVIELTTKVNTASKAMSQPKNPNK